MTLQAQVCAAVSFGWAGLCVWSGLPVRGPGGPVGWSSLGLAEEDGGGDGLDGAGFLDDGDDAEPCAAGAGEYVDVEDPHQEVGVGHSGGPGWGDGSCFGGVEGLG